MNSLTFLISNFINLVEGNEGNQGKVEVYINNFLTIPSINNYQYWLTNRKNLIQHITFDEYTLNNNIEYRILVIAEGLKSFRISAEIGNSKAYDITKTEIMYAHQLFQMN